MNALQGGMDATQVLRVKRDADIEIHRVQRRTSQAGRHAPDDHEADLMPFESIQELPELMHWSTSSPCACQASRMNFANSSTRISLWVGVNSNECSIKLRSIPFSSTRCTSSGHSSGGRVP